jgi:nitroimidazol reductase NimA-like FMN-containing flavoprotein (pyridoxamine 5'-phosphate oxidase superfamily)
MSEVERSAAAAAQRYVPSARSQTKRRKERISYDCEAVHAVLDEGLVGHVGIVDDGRAFVLPMAYARIGSSVYLHGARASRLLRNLCTTGGSATATMTVTLLDGVVLARSAFHHSMNFRSVAIFGTCSGVDDPGEKMDAMHALIEHVAKGRWADTRQPNRAEMAATLAVRLDIEEASVKSRSGAPVDDEEDYALGHWAGVMQFPQLVGAAVADPRLEPGCEVPAYALRYSRGT